MKLLAELKASTPMKARYLYNPFTQIAGFKAFITGIGGFLLTTYLAFKTGTHFIGLLNLDFAKDSDYWVYLTENLSSWLFISIFLHLSGIIFSKSKIRPIDTFGTTLLSRIPLVLTPLIRTIPIFQSFVINAWEMYFILAFYFVSLIWTIILLFNAFRISCNLKNEKLIGSFILSLILAEICIKVVLKLII
jgi:hypothetical protein